MINNIGITQNSTHYDGNINLISKGLRRMFLMDRYELDTEKIKHPTKVEDHMQYKVRAYRIYGWGHPVIKAYRVVETTFYKIKCGKIKDAISDIKRKYNKLVNGTSS